MKKIFKIVAIVIVSIFLLLIIIPFAFKGQILRKAKTEINKTLDAHVEFDNLRLSLIRGFPNLYIALENLSVVGKGDFEKDTLVSFKSFNLTVDLISAIKMKDIDVKSITLDHPNISARVLKDGRANWDIMKETEPDEEVIDTIPSEPMDISVKLKKFEIISANIFYADASSNMSASLENFNFLLRGNLAQDFTTIEITSSTDKVNVVDAGIGYLKDVLMKFSIAIDADMVNNVFTLKENEFSLNDLMLGWDGKVAMIDENIDVDLVFGTKKTDFKSVLSLVPAVYMTDFADVQTEGAFKLDGYAKGILSEETQPSAGIDFLVENAMFRYPDLPSAAENIQIAVNIFYDGVENDNTTVDVNKFHVELASNPVDFVLNLKTPISDPFINSSLNGRIDLATLSSVIPMEDATMAGIIQMNVEMMGNLSSIENERYQEFKTTGSVDMTGIQYTSLDFPQGVRIDKANLIFSPDYLNLRQFDMYIGKSDFHLTGRIIDFIPYVLADEVIKADFRFTSALIDANEFLTEEEAAVVEETTDTVALTVFEVPSNVHFVLSTKIDNLLYDNMDIKNISGIVEIVNNTALLTNLRMNMLDGTIIINGEYNTTDVNTPMVDFSLAMTNIDIPQAFNTFNTIEQLAPVAGKAKGKVSASIHMSTFLDDQMNPLMNTLVAEGNLKSRQIEIDNYTIFEKIGEYLKNDKFSKLTLSDVDLNFEVRDGRVYIEPFDTKFGNNQLTIGGDQGIDQTMNYLMHMAVPRGEFGAGANQLVQNLQTSAANRGVNVDVGETVNLNVGVTGTFSDPEISINLAESKASVVESIKEQVREQVTEKVTETITEIKDDAKERISAEAERIMARAEREAASIRESAQKAADAVKAESKTQADALIREAQGKPRFAQEAAKRAAEKVTKEGNEKADRIIKEGDAKAEAVLRAARSEVDKLK